MLLPCETPVQAQSASQLPPAFLDREEWATVHVAPHNVVHLDLGSLTQVQHWTVKPVQQLGQ